MSRAALLASPRRPAPAAAPAELGTRRRAVRDAAAVTLGGQIERVVGVVTALSLRRLLDPGRLGVYSGLRLFLDNTNRSSLGVGLGAVQRIPVLRAAGREAEARHLADVAHTVNTLTCVLYALGLLALAAWRFAAGPGAPYAIEWAGGLAAVAGLAILKRYESFLIAVLRAHGEFVLTARVDVLEAMVSAVAVAGGLLLAGFWGLLGAVALILSAKVVYLHARHPLRFGWAWDVPTAWALMVAGLPILLNTAAYGGVLGLDRAWILATWPDAERAAGLYSVAALGTSWCLDVAGRIVLVLYTTFQVTFGREACAATVARRAARSAEALAALVGPLAAGAYLVGPDALGWLLPRYAGGLAAIRPLLPGAMLLALAGPARQMLLAVERPFRLLAATTAGLAACAAGIALGAPRFGLAGVAAGMSAGAAVLLLATTAAALGPTLGAGAVVGHLARLARVLAWHAAGALLAAHLPLPRLPLLLSWLARLAVLAAWCTPPMVAEAARLGLLDRVLRRHASPSR